MTLPRGPAARAQHVLCAHAAVLLIAVTTNSVSSTSARSRPPDYRVILPTGRWKIRTSSELVVYVFSMGSTWKDFIIGPPDNCSISMCKGVGRLFEKRACDSLCYTGKWREAGTILGHAQAEFNRAAAKLDASISDVESLSATHLCEGHESSTPDVVALLQLLRAKHKPAGVVDVLSLYREMARKGATEVGRGQMTDLSGTIHLAERLNYGIEDWRSEALQAAAQYSLIATVLNGAQHTLATCAQGLVMSDMTGCYPGMHGGPELFADTPLLNVLHSDYDGTVVIARRTRFTPTAFSRWYMAFTDILRGNQTCWVERRMVTDGAADYTEPFCNDRGLCEAPAKADRIVALCEPNKDMWLGPLCPLVCGADCFGPLCYKPQSGTYNLRTPPGLLPMPVRGPAPRGVYKPTCVISAKMATDPELYAEAELTASHAENVSHLVSRGRSVHERLLVLERSLIKPDPGDTPGKDEMMSVRTCESLLIVNGWMSVGTLLVSLVPCLVAVAVSFGTNRSPVPLLGAKGRSL